MDTDKQCCYYCNQVLECVTKLRHLQAKIKKNNISRNSLCDMVFKFDDGNDGYSYNVDFEDKQYYSALTSDIIKQLFIDEGVSIGSSSRKRIQLVIPSGSRKKINYQTDKKYYLQCITEEWIYTIKINLPMLSIMNVSKKFDEEGILRRKIMDNPRLCEYDEYDYCCNCGCTTINDNVSSDADDDDIGSDNETEVVRMCDDGDIVETSHKSTGYMQYKNLKKYKYPLQYDYKDKTKKNNQKQTKKLKF